MTSLGFRWDRSSRAVLGDALVVRGFGSQVLPMPLLSSAERARYVAEALLPGLPQALLLIGLATAKRKKR